ncbi:MAG TPA: ATP-binding cassette domain-containing protein, partial [Roseiarcus sp.]|nr:ATP-binding cassette domain-containing protein [Roseiarcus sp.]
MPPLLQLRDMVVTLGGAPLLDGAELSISAADRIAVVGRNGSGKSTLFRAIAGIWPFGEGVILEPKAKIMLLPQRPYIPLGTLRNAIAYPSDAAVL